MERLRREPVFQGLHVPAAGGIRASVSVYADDMTLFLDRDKEFSAVECVLKAFSDATRARVNPGKSMFLYIRACAERTEVRGGSLSARMGIQDFGGCRLD